MIINFKKDITIINQIAALLKQHLSPNDLSKDLDEASKYLVIATEIIELLKKF